MVIWEPGFKQGWIPRLVWSSPPFPFCLGFCICRKAVLVLTQVSKAFRIPLTAIVTVTHSSFVYVLPPFPLQTLLESSQRVAGSRAVAVCNCIRALAGMTCPPIPTRTPHCLLAKVRQCGPAQERCGQKKGDLYPCENGLNYHSAALVDDLCTREEAGLQWAHFTPVHRKTT